MKIWEKTLSVGLSLVMCASLVAPSFAASFKELQTVIDTKTSLMDGDDNVRIGYEDGTVTLHEDVKYESGDPQSITIKNGTNVTIDLNGNDIDAQKKTNTSVITINKGGELNLTDSTGHEEQKTDEDGNLVFDEDGSPVMEYASGSITGGTGNKSDGYYYGYAGGVYNAGTFNMEGGSIEGNTASRYGAGVYNTGTFNMEGGTIEGNTIWYEGMGGGVYNTGTFNMTDGSIEGNTSYFHAGGVYSTGTFNMEGGTISGNTAERKNGGGIYNTGTFTMTSGTIEGNTANGDGGGGVYNTGTFNMEHGTIEGNTAKGYGGGVFNTKKGTFIMEDGTINGNKANDGGGIRNDGTFTMEDGTISGNTAGTYGGGISSEKAFTMESGTISGNTAGGGGGVYSTMEGFTMKDGTISGNTATWSGGGVYNSTGTFTMTGGTISGNTSYSNGGGVRNVSTFNMEGGTISGNTAEMYGGGVYNDCVSYNKPGKFTMTGSTIEDNTAGVAGDEIYASKSGGWWVILYLPEDLLWDQDNASDRENGVEKVYGGGKSISSSNIGFGLKHHEHENAVTTEPTCTEAGEAHIECICGFKSTEPIAPLGHDMGEWYETIPAQPGVEGEEQRDCARGDYSETRPIPALPVPDPTPVTDPTTEIEDVDVPLAGIFTRADAIGYLWEQTGSPEWELSDFPDVPEDHQWAVAIGWAQDMGIALPDQDGNFRPDDPVLRSVESLEISPEGELQEFLNRYAVFAGIELDAGELFIELAGAWDDVIMREEAEVIFNDFFAKLAAALAQGA